MPEILTESFCERCGTRYTFEAAEPKGKRLGKLKTFSKGFVNFVSNDETSLDEAFAEARSDEQRELTNQQLDAFHQTFQFCMSCRQYTCANCWNESESRCLSCAPHLGTDILEAPFPGLDPLARIGFGAPPAVAGATNGYANGHPDELAGLLGAPAPSSTASADAWPTADRSSTEMTALALPAGDAAAASPEPGAPAEPMDARPESAAVADVAAQAATPAAEAASAEVAGPAATPATEAASATEPDIDPDVAAAAAAVEEAHRAAALAEVERERAAEFERARRSAEAAEQAETDRSAEAGREAQAERLAAVVAEADAERVRAEARQAAEQARLELEATERQRQVAADALAAEERADAEDQARADEQARAAAEIDRQQADAVAERARRVAAEAERQRIAFQDAEHARQAAALAAAASMAPAQPTGPDSDRFAAAPDRTSELMDRFRPRQDDKLGPPEANPQAWQITAPEAGPTGPAPTSVDPLDLGRTTLQPQPPLPTRPGSPASTSAGSGAPDWPSPATTPPPQWPMPAGGRSADTGLWAASSREVAAAAAPTGVQACTSCGLPLSANARFCRRCGTQQH
jgi:ribosomal protein L40E